MSPLLIPILALLIPIVAILSGTYAKIAKTKAEAAAQLGRATGHLEDELAEARRDRDRLRRRLEAVEAIVTSEGYDLEREARRAGLATSPDAASPPAGPPDRAGRIDGALLDGPPGDAGPADGPRQPLGTAGRPRTR